MKKIAIFLVYIIVITSVLFGGTASFAANYIFNYELYPAEDITSTSAVISGKIIQGDKTNDDITLPGYAFELVVYETGSLSSKQSIPLSYAMWTYEFSEKVENLKPDTVYSYYVSGGINVTPVSGTPTERTFKTLTDEIKDFKYGDVNGDNKVNSTDHSLLKRYILETVTDLSEKGLKAADVNADGKINSSDLVLIKRYILELIDIFPAEEELEYKWVPYLEAGYQRIGFSVDKGEDGNYMAALSFTFPDSGFRVIYKDEVTKELPEKGDSCDMIIKGGNVQVERYMGPALTVITTRKITYNLGKINPGEYKFIIDIYGIQREFSFEVKENEEKWVPYQLKKEQVAYSVAQNNEGDYIVNVKMTFPSGGFRVDYTDEVTQISYESPVEGANIGFKGFANVEEWTGGSPAVITTKELKYTIGKLAPGKYRFTLNSYQFTDDFDFEVSEEQEDSWESYMPSPDDVSYTIKREDDGKYYIVFAVDFPTEGFYRVEYSDQLGVAAAVYPDGSTLISYKLAKSPQFFRYKGEAQAIKTLYLRYPLAGPGRITFEFLGISYSFTV